MNIPKQLNFKYLNLILMSIISCNRPKRIYLGNKTDKSITLQVDASFEADKGTILSEFKEALNGKRIEPGSAKINFGPGKWNAEDEASLKLLLQNISVKKVGSNTN